MLLGARTLVEGAAQRHDRHSFRERHNPMMNKILIWYALLTISLASCTSTPMSQATTLPDATLPVTTPPRSGLAAPLQCSDAEPPPITDLAVRQPPATSEPAPRAAFRDPVFGRCLVRVTDRVNDKTEAGGLKNEYARVQAFNADESRILVMGTQGGWYLYDAQTLQPLGVLPLGIDPRWSETNPDIIYVSDETRLMAYNIATQQTALVHEFADDFPGQRLAAVWGRYEGSPSRDGRWWGLMAEDQDWLTSALLVYDLQTNQVTATLDTRGWSAAAREIDSVTISPLGNYVLVYLDQSCTAGHLGTPSNPCGLMVYDRSLQNGRGLLRIVGHSDTALDAQGREVLVYQDIDTDHISILDLATGAVTPLWPIDFTDTSIGLHFSGRAFDRPGWAVVSTHDGDAAAHTWMDDSVFLIELAANGRVVRLAHTHSLVDENQEHDYWAEPQATANRGLTRVLFTTNWGRSGTEQVELYQMYVPPEAFAHIYYVAPNGNNSNPGTIDRPWRTIQKAADTLTAGEMVYLRAGTYREQVVPQHSGSEGNVIVYAAYPGETVTVDGATVNVPEWAGLFHIANVSHIRVSGLRVVNAGPNPHNPGILLDRSSYITIENNVVSNANDSGIGVWNSDHIRVKNNEVTNSCLAGFNETISVGGTDIFEISHNRVHDSPREGIDVKDGSSNGKIVGNEVYNTAAVGLYVDAWDKHTYNIDVYQNIVHDVLDDGFALASEMGGLLENVRVYNNLSYNNRYVGIAVTRNGDSTVHPMRGIAIVNNTVSGNGLDDWGGGITVDSNEAENVLVSNNIVSGNLSFQIVVDAGVPSVAVDHNLIDGFRGEAGETHGTNNVEGKPRFVNPAVANYRLQSDSPAIDAGDNASVPTGAAADLDSNPRIVGGTVDIGAYEFQDRMVFLPLILQDTPQPGSAAQHALPPDAAPLHGAGEAQAVRSALAVKGGTLAAEVAHGPRRWCMAGIECDHVHRLQAYQI